MHYSNLISEKLKAENVYVQVGNKDVLNCYYAHAEDSLQVCCDEF